MARCVGSRCIRKRNESAGRACASRGSNVILTEEVTDPKRQRAKAFWLMAILSPASTSEPEPVTPSFVGRQRPKRKIPPGLVPSPPLVKLSEPNFLIPLQIQVSVQFKMRFFLPASGPWSQDPHVTQPARDSGPTAAPWGFLC